MIAPKCYWSQVSRFQESRSKKDVRAKVEGSLYRLGTDCRDIRYLHRFDDETPIKQTLRAVDDLVSKRKVNYIDISACNAWRLVEGLWKAGVNNDEAFTVTQPQYSAVYRGEILDSLDMPPEHVEPIDKYLDVCEEDDLAVCPYSPLSRGFLTGQCERAEAGKNVAPDGSRADVDVHFERDYMTEAMWNVLDEIRTIKDAVNALPAQVSLRWLREIQT